MFGRDTQLVFLNLPTTPSFKAGVVKVNQEEGNSQTSLIYLGGS